MAVPKPLDRLPRCRQFLFRWSSSQKLRWQQEESRPLPYREQSVRKGAKTPQFVGTLLIESDPAGAAAFVNQESVGNTPVLLKDLRAGSYVVRLEYEGYQRWSSAATVSAVRQERVKAKLDRERSR